MSLSPEPLLTPGPTPPEPDLELTPEPSQEGSLPTYWGSLLALEKPPDCMRLLLQNPHGLDAKNNYRKIDLAAKYIAAYQFDIACLPETNADWKKYGSRKACNALLRQHLRHHRLITSCSQATAAHSFLPGGTATIVANNWTGRISESGEDPHGMGRWSFVRTKGKTAQRLLIVTVYQVCKQSINSAGDTTAFSQQWHHLRASGNESPDPRKQFSCDLSNFLDQFPADHIIIAGDLNSWLRDPNDDKKFGELILKHRLQDILIQTHGMDSEIPTRKEGRRIDYILATEDVADAVLSCGALHFDHVVDSDHRGLFLDLDIDSLLGGRPPTLSSPALRGIDSTNPKQCKIYLDKLTTYFARHKIHARTQKLVKWTHQHGLTDRITKRWEKLDLDITKGCLHAERCSGRKDRPAWSAQLHHAHLSVVYLKIAIRALNRNQEYLQAVHPFLQASDIFTPPEFSDIQGAVEALRVAKATLKEIRKNAKAYRESFLEERAAAAAAASDLTAEQAINSLLQREGTKRAYATLRRYLRPNEFSTLTEVHILQPDGTTKVVSEPTEMYDRIIDRDIQHYGQAEGTPCTKSPIKEWLGTAGDTEICDSWLNGESPPNIPGAFPETQLLVDLLKCDSLPTSIDNTVTVADYKQFFGRWAEKTSTSQDRHLGHWKAIISHTAQLHFPDDCDLIVETLVAQMNLSLTHGYAWRRWKRIVSAKIPKRAGNMLLHKLRTIHLMEADFNWLQGLTIGRRMIKNAETNNALHDGQWGCRPGRHAIGAVMLKVMSYEIARITRTPLGSFDMDAASCFDRIIMALGLLLCRRQGVPSGTCLMAATVLLYASFYIKTTHGISENWYSSTAENPTHGPGQGSRIGPALWVLLSCLMFAAMEEACHGAEFCDPTQSFSHQRTGDGFVDDVANVFNFGLAEMLEREYSPQQIAEGMQAEAQVWERLLYTTGGALELTKCFYYIIAWDFQKNGAPILLTPPDMPDTQISITSGANPDPITIEQKDANTAHVTLGVRPDPSAGTDTQADFCFDRSGGFAEGIRHSNMGRNEALMGYRHIWLPSVGYALAAWPLHAKQLQRITVASNNAFIPKMGFCRSTCRHIIFGSKAYGGFGLTPLADFQGVNQTTLFVQHIRLMDSVGKMLRIGYSWAQLFCGVSFQILSEPTVNLPHAPIGWFYHLRRFLSLSEVTIELPSPIFRLPQLLRRGDSNLMDAFLSLKRTPAKIRTLNLCRLYLKVESLAELCDVDGTKLLPAAWNGNPLPTTSTLLWPRQGRPSCWATWRQALAELFLKDTTAAHRQVGTLYLRSRLGRWNPTFARDRTWPAYQDYEHLFILDTSFRHRHSYLAFKDQLSGRLPNRNFAEKACGRHKDPASLDGIVPAEPQKPRCGSRKTMSPVGFFSHIFRHDTPDQPYTIYAHLDQLEPWESSLFPYVQSLCPLTALRDFLMSSTTLPLFIVHDGGAAENGSFGWSIASPTQSFWEGSGATAGRNPGSFRAESYGMLAALRFLIQYMIFYNFTPVAPDLEHFQYTDSKSLLGRISTSLARFYPSPGACLASEFDLEIAIRKSIEQLDLRITRKHVKGHQDDEESQLQIMSWPAQLNVICDNLATHQLHTTQCDPTVLHNPYCHAYITIRGESATGQIRKALFDAAGRPRLRTYLLDKHHWSDETFQQVNWGATLSAICALSIPEHQFVIKLAFRQLPIGTRLQQRAPHIKPNCPSCDHLLEDDWHWITCPARAEWRRTQSTLLADRLRSLKTNPALKMFLMRAFNSLMNTGTYTFDADAQLTPHEARLVDSQNRIGWAQIIGGRFSVEWSRLQEMHIDEEKLDGRYFSGCTWTSKVTKHIWRALHDLWKVRNTALHGETFTENEATRRSRIEPLVRRLYERIYELPDSDRHMLRNKPIDERLAQPLSIIETWLSIVEPAFEAARYPDDDSMVDDPLFTQATGTPPDSPPG